MRKTILSFAVAVLLGLISAQVGTGSLPAYATYQGQAGVNQKFAAQYGINTTDMAALNGGFGQPGMGFDNLGVWGGASTGAKTGAVSLQAMAASPVNPVAATAPAAPIAPTIPTIDPILAAKMAQLQADFEMRQMAME